MKNTSKKIITCTKGSDASFYEIIYHCRHCPFRSIERGIHFPYDIVRCDAPWEMKAGQRIEIIKDDDDIIYRKHGYTYRKMRVLTKKCIGTGQVEADRPDDLF